MKTMKAILIILTAIAAVLLFIHRNAIKAAIKGEPLPEIPEGHPECCPLTKKEC